MLYEEIVDLKANLERHFNLSNQFTELQNKVENNSKSNFKLPKNKFHKFGGNLKNYLSFCELFKKILEDLPFSQIWINFSICFDLL